MSEFPKASRSKETKTDHACKPLSLQCGSLLIHVPVRSSFLLVDRHLPFQPFPRELCCSPFRLTSDEYRCHCEKPSTRCDSWQVTHDSLSRDIVRTVAWLPDWTFLVDLSP